MRLISSALVSAGTTWYRNMVSCSGPNHWWPLVLLELPVPEAGPTTGGSARAKTLNEGWTGKMDLEISDMDLLQRSMWRTICLWLDICVCVSVSVCQDWSHTVIHLLQLNPFQGFGEAESITALMGWGAGRGGGGWLHLEHFTSPLLRYTET